MASVGVDEYAPAADDAVILRELGRYRLLALIGRGGMGDIYLAMAHGDLGFKKLVVVKCLRAGADENEAMRRMFLDEGELAARLTHAHVVQTYEVGEVEGLQYMAMEYLDGQPLSKIRRTLHPLDQRLAVKIVADGLAGLHYAHELRDFDGQSLNIVHRDLSPPNIFVTYDGVVKLVDFGIAKTTLASRAMTEVGVLKGKIGYMAPEHVARNTVDRRADVFAMGVVLWELLAHRRLVTEKAPVAALRFLLHGQFAPPSSIRPEVDPELDRIVLRALQKRAEDRYPTALDMRADLEAYLVNAGANVRNEDLARFMGERFGENRQRRGQEIREWIAQADAGNLPVEATREQIGSTLDSEARAASPLEPSASSSVSRKISSQTTGSIGAHATTGVVEPAPRKRARGKGIVIATSMLVPCVAWAVFIYEARQNADPAAASSAVIAPAPPAPPAVPARVDPKPVAPVVEAREAPPPPAPATSVEPKAPSAAEVEMRLRPSAPRARVAPPAPTSAAPATASTTAPASAPVERAVSEVSPPVAAPTADAPAGAIGSAVEAPPADFKKRAPASDDRRPAEPSE